MISDKGLLIVYSSFGEIIYQLSFIIIFKFVIILLNINYLSNKLRYFQIQ